MLEWKQSGYSPEIEVEPEHIIGRSKGIKILKKNLATYDLNVCKKKVCKYKLANLQIEVKDEPLNQWEENAKIKIGTSLFAKKQIYKVIQEMFNKKILLKDESRAIKKEFGMNYTLTVQKPTNGAYPLIVMTKEYAYAIAPCLEGD